MNAVIKQNLFLTIDDAPSAHFLKKVSLLKENKIPALFFIRGEFAEKRIHLLAKAIEEDFLLGNHSYSHPYFSRITMEERRSEILKTEEIIEKAYQLAEVKRPLKIFRFPFGDEAPLDSDIKLPALGWTIEIKDYSAKLSRDIDTIIKQFSSDLEKAKNNRDTQDHLILMHDFEHNTHCLPLIIEEIKRMQKNFHLSNFF